MTTVRPIGERVLVRRDKAEEETPGGIVLPDYAKDTPTRGSVVAVGNGKLLNDGTRCEMSVKEGDTVVFGMYAGTEIEVDGETLVVLNEADLLAIVTEEPAPLHA